MFTYTTPQDNATNLKITPNQIAATFKTSPPINGYLLAIYNGLPSDPDKVLPGGVEITWDETMPLQFNKFTTSDGMFHIGPNAPQALGNGKSVDYVYIPKQGYYAGTISYNPDGTHAYMIADNPTSYSDIFPTKTVSVAILPPLPLPKPHHYLVWGILLALAYYFISKED